MKKALMIASVLFIAVISTACINNIAVQELNNKAAEYMEKGDYESAMDRLQASLDLDATMYETYYNLGIASINAKKYEKAIEAFEGGIKIKPDYSDFYYSLGLAQNDLAEEILESSVSDQEEDIDQEPKKEDISSDNESESMDEGKILKLKKSSLENLKKYIEMSPNSDDKDSVNSLIAELNEYISKNENNSVEKE